MKVCVVYPKKNKHAKVLATDLAYEARTRAISHLEYNYKDNYDLLVIVYQDTFRNKELKSFIDTLSRSNASNVCLCNLFYFDNHSLKKVLDRCYKRDLPMMREVHSTKIPLFKPCCVNSDVCSRGRTFISEMMTIVQNYY